MRQEFFDESHHMLRDSLKKFIAQEIAPHVEHWEEEGSFPKELYKKAGDAGFLGLGYPEEYGGTPGDFFHTVVYMEEMMRCGSVGVVASLNCGLIAAPLIYAIGTEEQKQKFLPPVISGEQVAVLGVTEPNGGSDVANLRTRVERKGDTYVVNGSKIFITGGTFADYVVTAVRTGGAGNAGISALIVPTSTPGFGVSRTIKKMGWWASDTAELFFEDCVVPVENRLGEENKGFRYFMMNFAKERTILAVEAQGIAEYALELSLKYAKERVAFGHALTGFQVTRHKLAEMATWVEASKQFNYSVASKICDGIEVSKEAAMAKNFATKACDKVVYDAVQIHGGYGYCREYLVERLYRDSRALSIGGGTYEIMNEVIGKKLGL